MGVVGVFVRVCVWGVVVLVLIFKLTEKMNLGFFYTSSDEDSLVHSTASKRSSQEPQEETTPKSGKNLFAKASKMDSQKSLLKIISRHF